MKATSDGRGDQGSHTKEVEPATFERNRRVVVRALARSITVVTACEGRETKHTGVNVQRSQRHDVHERSTTTMIRLKGSMCHAERCEHCDHLERVERGDWTVVRLTKMIDQNIRRH